MDETLKIIEDIFDYNKGAKNFFRLHQKLIKENQNQKIRKSILLITKVQVICTKNYTRQKVKKMKIEYN